MKAPRSDFKGSGVLKNPILAIIMPDLDMQGTTESKSVATDPTQRAEQQKYWAEHLRQSEKQFAVERRWNVLKGFCLFLLGLVGLKYLNREVMVFFTPCPYCSAPCALGEKCRYCENNT